MNLVSIKYGLGGLDKSDYPWVALLVFREDELEWTDGNGKTHLNIFKGENAILSSSVSPSLPGTPPTNVNIVRPHIDTLKSIMPKLDELRLLCHARQVNPRDKELCGNDDDGWFSVVMSNRVLLPNKKYHACLVSLEGDGTIFEENASTCPKFVESYRTSCQ